MFQHPETAHTGLKSGIRKLVPLERRRQLRRAIFLAQNPSKIAEMAGVVGPKRSADISRLSEEGFLEISGERSNRLFGPVVRHFTPLLDKAVEASGDECPKSPLTQKDIYSQECVQAILADRWIFDTIRGYFRARPNFHSAVVWVGLANGPRSGSPLLHLDSGGEKIVRLYIYLNDVDIDNGAFSFLPRRLSRRFSDFSGYLGNAVTDDDFRAIASKAGIAPDAIKAVTGKAGTGFLIDTAQDFHYGSRISRGCRYAMIITWMMAPDADESRHRRALMRECVLENGGRIEDYPCLYD